MRNERSIRFLSILLGFCVSQFSPVIRAYAQDGVEVPVSLSLYYCGDIDQPAAEPGQWEPTARDFYFDLFLSQSNVAGDGSFLIYTTNEPDPREVTYRIKLLNEGAVIGDIPLHPEEMEYVSNPVVSSDGNAIAYWAKDLSGEVDIYVRKRTADSLEFSNPHGIGTTIPGEICGVSNDGNFVLLNNRLIGTRFAAVLSEFWNGPARVTELFSSRTEDLGWEGTKISGGGKWIYVAVSGSAHRALFSHFVDGSWTTPVQYMMDDGKGMGVAAWNSDATYILRAETIWKRTGETFERVWEFVPPGIKEYPQISEDGRTVAFIIEEHLPSRPYWDGSIAPYPMMWLYVARLEEKADGGSEVQLKMIDKGKGISFRLYGDGKHILWAVTNTRYASSVQGWRGK